MATDGLPLNKQLINAVDDVVVEAIDGFLAGNPQLTRLDGLPDVKVVLRADWRKEQVALISGGGSGHEPSFVGCVGAGMLTAAVAGNVFASPSVAAVLAAVRATAGDAGALLIVMNYTGDRLNFGLAAESARSEGFAVEVVFVDDDAALDSGKITGRRGLAGTVLVHKVAGAVAAAGAPLAAVAAAARAAAARVATIGVALSVCTVPGQPRSDRLDEAGVMELGLGIHGEPGASRIPVGTAAAAVEAMVDKLLASPAAPPAGGRVAVLVNNLGGTAAVELSVVTHSALRRLAARGLSVVRLYSGAVMTALDMHGCSISLLFVDDDSLGHLDAPTSVPGWPVVAGVVPDPSRCPAPVPVPTPSSTAAADADTPLADDGKALAARVQAGCAAVLVQVPELTRLDTLIGDGDCGTTFERGARRVSELVAASLLTHGRGDIALTSPRAFFRTLGSALRLAMGGTSGVILGIMASAAEAHLATVGVAEQWAPPTLAAAFKAAVHAAMHYGNAKAGDATMVDALLPAAEAAVATAGDGAARLSAAATAARAGAAATADMTAGAGRASYLADTSTAGVQDPGAVAVAAILTGAAQ